MPADQARIDRIRTHFAPLVGTRIVRSQTAERLVDDGTWESWKDLPIRLYTDGPSLVSIAWSCFDDLWLANDESLPFYTDDVQLRWVENAIPSIRDCIGRTIDAVLLGRGQMSIQGTEIEIWTRLLLKLDTCWLEIFNALDENGYDLHANLPEGEFVTCASTATWELN